MTADEVIDLLTLAAAYDRRTVGEADVTAWLLAIGDLSSEDAQAAVAGHYRDTTDWLMPAHVRARVTAIRAERIRRTLIPAPPPELADDPAAYRAALAESVRRAGDGELPPAIAGAPAAERRHVPPALLAHALTELRTAFRPGRGATDEEGSR